MLKKLSFALAAILSVSLLASCVINTSDDDDEKGSGVDYKDYSKTSDYCVNIKNNTSNDLVCFKGTPSKSTILGGVKAYSQTALKGNTSLFQQSQDYVLFLVKASDYEANKDSLENLKTTPFGQVYCYWNADNLNTRLYEISSHMGGEATLYINNTSSYNVELREGGLYEAAIGYVASMDIQKKFPLDKQFYYIYPVYRKFDKKSSEIISAFPKLSNGKNVVQTFGFDDETNEIELDAGKWAKSDTFKLSPSCAYLAINNTTTSGGVQLYDGLSTALQTTSGYTSINAGKTRMFDIAMTKTGDAEYATSAIKASFSYGTAATNKWPIPSQEYKAGYLYTYVIEDANKSEPNPYELFGYFQGQKVDNEGKVSGDASETEYKIEE